MYCNFGREMLKLLTVNGIFLFLGKIVILPYQTIYHKQRLGLQSNLRKRALFDEYDLESKKLLDNGHSEDAPTDITLERTWYIPHHCVPKKEDQIRLVFHCASVFKGVSLNTEVHQGPDYVNKLNFVLLRFRHHPYAKTADIRSMYNCVKVPPSDRNTLRFLWFKDGIMQQFRITSHLFWGGYGVLVVHHTHSVNQWIMIPVKIL